MLNSSALCRNHEESFKVAITDNLQAPMDFASLLAGSNIYSFLLRNQLKVSSRSAVWTSSRMIRKASCLAYLQRHGTRVDTPHPTGYSLNTPDVSFTPSDERTSGDFIPLQNPPILHLSCTITPECVSAAPAVF